MTYCWIKRMGRATSHPMSYAIDPARRTWSYGILFIANAYQDTTGAPCHSRSCQEEVGTGLTGPEAKAK